MINYPMSIFIFKCLFSALILLNVSVANDRESSFAQHLDEKIIARECYNYLKDAPGRFVFKELKDVDKLEDPLLDALWKSYQKIGDSQNGELLERSKETFLDEILTLKLELKIDPYAIKSTFGCATNLEKPLVIRLTRGRGDNAIDVAMVNVNIAALFREDRKVLSSAKLKVTFHNKKDLYKKKSRNLTLNLKFSIKMDDDIDVGTQKWLHSYNYFNFNPQNSDLPLVYLCREDCETEKKRDRVKLGKLLTPNREISDTTSLVVDALNTKNKKESDGAINETCDEDSNEEAKLSSKVEEIQECNISLEKEKELNFRLDNDLKADGEMIESLNLELSIAKDQARENKAKNSDIIQELTDEKRKLNSELGQAKIEISTLTNKVIDLEKKISELKNQNNHKLESVIFDQSKAREKGLYDPANCYVSLQVVGKPGTGTESRLKKSPLEKAELSFREKNLVADVSGENTLPRDLDLNEVELKLTTSNLPDGSVSSCKFNDNSATISLEDYDVNSKVYKTTVKELVSNLPSVFVFLSTHSGTSSENNPWHDNAIVQNDLLSNFVEEAIKGLKDKAFGKLHFYGVTNKGFIDSLETIDISRDIKPENINNYSDAVIRKIRTNHQADYTDDELITILKQLEGDGALNSSVDRAIIYGRWLNDANNTCSPVNGFPVAFTLLEFTPSSNESAIEASDPLISYNGINRRFPLYKCSSSSDVLHWMVTPDGMSRKLKEAHYKKVFNVFVDDTIKQFKGE